MSLETEEPRIAGQDPYEEYEYADGPIRIFRQRKAFHGQPGEVENLGGRRTADTALGEGSYVRYCVDV